MLWWCCRQRRMLSSCLEAAFGSGVVERSCSRKRRSRFSCCGALLTASGLACGYLSGLVLPFLAARQLASCNTLAITHDRAKKRPRRGLTAPFHSIWTYIYDINQRSRKFAALSDQDCSKHTPQLCPSRAQPRTARFAKEHL